MNRRRFFGAAGAYAAISAQAVGTDTPETPAKRIRIDLNGPWTKSASGKFIRTVEVPCSERPSGTYELSREVAIPRLLSGERAILHFEGITYFARAFSNGIALGDMDPYVPYEFDITAYVKERSNIISLLMADFALESDHSGAAQIALGVNTGWEAYGGIIRDVWVEIRPATFVNSVQFGYVLQSNFRAARCTWRAELWSSQSTSGHATVSLRSLGRSIVSATQRFSAGAGTSTVEIGLDVPNPALWSPESPNLYDAAVLVETSAGIDQLSFRTGFRQFRVNGTAFELNGNPVLLNGVCRHDMWKDQGFTLTREQMKRDMQEIKAVGFNFVRLVHYPHHRYIIDLADELGLLVSEEPGYWGNDFRKMPRPMIDLGLRILDKTIRRDWNSPSVAAWLLANECHLTTEYLDEAKAVCRKLDPIGRLISAANSMPKEKAKPIFEQTGLDFFDDHPYTFDVDDFGKIAEFYGNSRPLTFSEWGGKEIGQQRQVMGGTVDAFLDLQKSNQLAGTAFWSWQDLPQFSRIDPEMRSGILESGVVTESRNPREQVVVELTRLCERRRHANALLSTTPEVIPLRHSPWTPGKSFKGIDLTQAVRSSEQIAAWNDFERILAEYWRKTPYDNDQWIREGRKFRLWRNGEINLLGIPFRTPVIDDYIRPIVLTPAHPEITCAIGVRCSGLHVLGHVSCPDGYPPLGQNGAAGATLRVHFKDDSGPDIPLRHGYELARANMIYLSSRVNPIASNAPRALQYVKDTAREVYQILLYSAPITGQVVQSITYRLAPGGQPMLLFAVNAEES